MSPAVHAKPHVLYVAWGYPPSRGGGVYRALATANGFAESGCRVTVLTADKDTFYNYTGADESLEERIHPDIEVVRVKFDWPNLEADVRKWSFVRTFAPKVWRKIQSKRDQLTFPEASYGPWRGPLEKAALAIHAKTPVDLTVATANPNVDFTAADVLHRKHGVPYVMDYRDAWMLDVFDGSFLHPEGSRCDKLEKRLLSSAREVWFVNEPIRAWHQQRHPELASRMYVVANGWDPEFAPEARLAPPPSDRPLTFGYIGTVSNKVPAAEFAAGWRIAKERSADLANARAQLWGYLGFYSTPNAVLQRMIDEYADVDLTYEGPVPKSKVRSIYEGFDVCLLILGAGKYVTSGKVFEYAASAMPIVAVHDPGNAATDVLQDYPLWFPVADLEPETIAEQVEKAAHAAREASDETRRACQDFALQYRRDLQLQPRIDSLMAGVS